MSLSEKKKELINLLHEDKLTQFGKEQIEAIIVNQQKEIDNLKEIEAEHKKINGELRKEIDEKTTIIFAGVEKVKMLEKEIEELNNQIDEHVFWESTPVEQIKNNYILKSKVEEKLEYYRCYKGLEIYEKYNFKEIVTVLEGLLYSTED